MPSVCYFSCLSVTCYCVLFFVFYFKHCFFFSVKKMFFSTIFLKLILLVHTAYLPATRAVLPWLIGHIYTYRDILWTAVKSCTCAVAPKVKDNCTYAQILFFFFFSSFLKILRCTCCKTCVWVSHFNHQGFSVLCINGDVSVRKEKIKLYRDFSGRVIGFGAICISQSSKAKLHRAHHFNRPYLIHGFSHNTSDCRIFWITYAPF